MRMRRPQSTPPRRLRPVNTATARPLPSLMVTSSDGGPGAGHHLQALDLAGEQHRRAGGRLGDGLDAEVGQPRP